MEKEKNVTWEDIENLYEKLKNDKNIDKNQEAEKLDYFKEKALNHLNNLQGNENAKKIIVFPLKKEKGCFKNDNDESLKELQYSMYKYAISTIFMECKRIYADNHYSLLYLSEDEIFRIKNADSFDHRLIQDLHNIIAAIFRFKLQKEELKEELFNNDINQIKTRFESIYIDTNFLLEIPQKMWHTAYKWHLFIKETICDNISIVREIISATILYKDCKDKKWESAYKARDILKSKYYKIPWLKRVKF